MLFNIYLHGGDRNNEIMRRGSSKKALKRNDCSRVQGQMEDECTASAGAAISQTIERKVNFKAFGPKF